MPTEIFLSIFCKGEIFCQVHFLRAAILGNFSRSYFFNPKFGTYFLQKIDYFQLTRKNFFWSLRWYKNRRSSFRGSWSKLGPKQMIPEMRPSTYTTNIYWQHPNKIIIFKGAIELMRRRHWARLRSTPLASLTDVKKFWL